MKSLQHLSEVVGGELHLLFESGPIHYAKDKVLGFKRAVENAFGLGNNNDENRLEDFGSGVPDDDLLDEANMFINEHMSEIQKVIAKTVTQVDPTAYDEQQQYLYDVFERAGDACWSYIQDIFNDPAVSPELSDKITETMVKDVAVIAAMVMFIEWGVTQKHDETVDNGQKK